MDDAIEKKYKNAFYRNRPEHKKDDDFSIRHPKMPLSQRAKIFSPFSALKGFEEAIDSKLEQYIEKIELSEETQAHVNQVLVELGELTEKRHQARTNHIIATVVYFVPCTDEYHEAYGLGGKYEEITGMVWKVDPVFRKAITIDDVEIDFSNIFDIRIVRESQEEN